MYTVRNCLRFRNTINTSVRRYVHYSSIKYEVTSTFLNGAIILNGRTNVNCRLCSKNTTSESEHLDIVTYEKVCDQTLESLTEYFEQILEEADNLKAGDVSYSSGVLTINLGPKYGVYVINRQSPNRQIWLSSPVSGPKRYDFIADDNCWVYKHDGQSLHELLQKEISKIVNLDLNFAKCLYARFN